MRALPPALLAHAPRVRSLRCSDGAFASDLPRRADALLGSSVFASNAPPRLTRYPEALESALSRRADVTSSKARDRALATCAASGRYPAFRGRGRLVDYGAALEMRFGATHRGFESRPLRHLRPPRWRPVAALAPPRPRSRTFRCARSGAQRRLATNHPRGGLTVFARSAFASPPGSRGLTSWCAHLGARLYDGRRHSPRRPGYPSRAVLGGELAVPCSLQSAPAGPNPLSRSPFSVAARRCDVEDRVPRSGEPRTVSGPEGSSTKRSSSGAAERPGPSRPSWWARATVDRRRVHGI